jgi:hypothetical protein
VVTVARDDGDARFEVDAATVQQRLRRRGRFFAFRMVSQFTCTAPRSGSILRCDDRGRLSVAGMVRSRIHQGLRGSSDLAPGGGQIDLRVLAPRSQAALRERR